MYSTMKIKVEVKILLFYKTLIAIPLQFFNYSNIFLAKNAVKLLLYIKINDHTIKTKKDKQLFFSPIYSLRPVELEILKTFIEINLVNGCNAMAIIIM